jgi:hypothetical protein
MMERNPAKVREKFGFGFKMPKSHANKSSAWLK